MTSSRSGVTLYMILALVLGLVIIGTTFTLNWMRTILPPPFLLEQKADYQMESAFVFCLSRLNEPRTASDEPLVRQEIAPGAWLTVTARLAGNGEWILNARVKAESWTRTLSARAVRTSVASSPASAPSELPPSSISHEFPVSPWRIFFLPAGEGETPLPAEKTDP